MNKHFCLRKRRVNTAKLERRRSDKKPEQRKRSELPTPSATTVNPRRTSGERRCDAILAVSSRDSFAARERRREDDPWAATDPAARRTASLLKHVSKCQFRWTTGILECALACVHAPWGKGRGIFNTSESDADISSVFSSMLLQEFNEKWIA